MRFLLPNNGTKAGTKVVLFFILANVYYFFDKLSTFMFVIFIIATNQISYNHQNNRYFCTPKIFSIFGAFCTNNNMYLCAKFSDK